MQYACDQNNKWAVKFKKQRNIFLNKELTPRYWKFNLFINSSHVWTLQVLANKIVRVFVTVFVLEQTVPRCNFWVENYRERVSLFRVFRESGVPIFRGDREHLMVRSAAPDRHVTRVALDAYVKGVPFTRQTQTVEYFPAKVYLKILKQKKIV